MKYRDLGKMTGPNDGTRTLLESTLVPEVARTLHDWIAGTHGKGVLIGGVALSFYVKPRYTQDVDIMFANDGAIPAEVQGFKRMRPHAFQHGLTHVEIEMVTPELINVDPVLVAAVMASAEVHDGIRVASPSGLVAIKLGRALGRSIAAQQDRVDIAQLIDLGRVDVAGFPLGEQELALYHIMRDPQQDD